MNKEKYYLNYEIESFPSEIWEDVFGYDGIYLVSNLGRVKSVEREIDMGGRGIRVQPERIRKQNVQKSNRNQSEPSKQLNVTLCVNGIKKGFCVSVLVGNAFIGFPKENEVFSKKDKIWDNNMAENLEISTISECAKLSYKKGNSSKAKPHLEQFRAEKVIYTRLKDNKSFTATELDIEYKKHANTQVRRAVRLGWNAYGSKWSSSKQKQCE